MQADQRDEIWSFVHAKERHLTPELKGVFGYGDVYTWVAIDAETKLVPCWNVGRRDAESGMAVIKDLSDRLASRVLLSTDGFKVYLTGQRDGGMGRYGDGGTWGTGPVIF